MASDAQPALSASQITEALDGMQRVALTGRSARPIGRTDPMFERGYDKGWDDCLDNVRRWLEMAGRP